MEEIEIKKAKIKSYDGLERNNSGLRKVLGIDQSAINKSYNKSKLLLLSQLLLVFTTIIISVSIE